VTAMKMTSKRETIRRKKKEIMFAVLLVRVALVPVMKRD
jgi:hypothetical protein